MEVGHFCHQITAVVLFGLLHCFGSLVVVVVVVVENSTATAAAVNVGAHSESCESNCCIWHRIWIWHWNLMAVCLYTNSNLRSLCSPTSFTLEYLRCGPFNGRDNDSTLKLNGSSIDRYGMDMDCDPSPENVKIMLEAADEMLKQKNVESVLFGGRRITDLTNMEKLDWFAGELVLEHRTRSCRIAPTVAFKQVTHEPTEDCR